MEHICAHTFPGILFYQDVDKRIKPFQTNKNGKSQP
jgi:hypothetical protein